MDRSFSDAAITANVAKDNDRSVLKILSVARTNQRFARGVVAKIADENVNDEEDEEENEKEEESNEHLPQNGEEFVRYFKSNTANIEYLIKHKKKLFSKKRSLVTGKPGAIAESLSNDIGSYGVSYLKWHSLRGSNAQQISVQCGRGRKWEKHRGCTKYGHNFLYYTGYHNHPQWWAFWVIVLVGIGLLFLFGLLWGCLSVVPSYCPTPVPVPHCHEKPIDIPECPPLFEPHQHQHHHHHVNKHSVSSLFHRKVK